MKISVIYDLAVFSTATASPSLFKTMRKKSRIRETKNLLTDVDSSTNTTVGWTKNTQKPTFFEKQKKPIQNAKNQKRLEICQN